MEKYVRAYFIFLCFLCLFRILIFILEENCRIVNLCLRENCMHEKCICIKHAGACLKQPFDIWEKCIKTVRKIVKNVENKK